MEFYAHEKFYETNSTIYPYNAQEDTGVPFDEISILF